MRYRVILQYYVEANSPEAAVLKVPKEYIERRLIDILDEQGQSHRRPLSMVSRTDSARMVDNYLKRGGKIKFSKKSKVGGMTLKEQTDILDILKKQGIIP